MGAEPVRQSREFHHGRGLCVGLGVAVGRGVHRGRAVAVGCGVGAEDAVGAGVGAGAPVDGGLGVELGDADGGEPAPDDASLVQPLAVRAGAAVQMLVAD